MASEDRTKGVLESLIVELRAAKEQTEKQEAGRDSLPDSPQRDVYLSEEVETLRRNYREEVILEAHHMGYDRIEFDKSFPVSQITFDIVTTSKRRPRAFIRKVTDLLFPQDIYTVYQYHFSRLRYEDIQEFGEMLRLVEAKDDVSIEAGYLVLRDPPDRAVVSVLEARRNLVKPPIMLRDFGSFD